MQDHNIEWVLEMRSAVLNISLVDLVVHRTIHATRVRGDGAVFRFRSRVILTETGSPTVAGYPPVPPYDDPPVAPAYVAPPPIPEDQYKLWTLFMEDVDVGVREAWLHELRYVADSVESRARGAFRLRPAKHLWVGPASLDLAPGEVTIRGERLVTGATGRVDCTVSPFDVYEPRGKEVFAFIDLSASIVGEVSSVAMLSAYLPQDVQVGDGSGAFRLRLAMHEGVLQKETRFHYETTHLRVDAPSVFVEAPLELWGEVTPDDYDAGSLVVRSPRLTAHRRDLATPLVITDLLAKVSSLTVAATGEPAVSSARVVVGEGCAKDARWLEWPSLRPGGAALHVHGGPICVHGGVASMPDESLSGNIDVSAVDAHVTAGGYSLSGSAHAATRFADVDRHAATGHATGAVTGRGLSFASPTGASASAVSAELTFAAASEPMKHRRADAKLTVRTLRFAKKGLMATAEAAHASLAVVGDGVELRDGSRVSVRLLGGSVLRPTWRGRGDVLLTARLEKAAARGQVALNTGLSLSRVSVRTARQSVDGWSAAAHVDGVASMLHGRPVDGTGAVVVTLHNGEPLLALLAAEDQTPPWLSSAMGGAPVYARARLVADRRRVDAVLSAEEGALSAHGCATYAAKRTNGAVLVRLADSPLSVGLNIHDGALRLAPIVGDGWLREHGGAPSPSLMCIASR